MKFRADGMLRTCHTDEHALRLQCRHYAVLVLRVDSREAIHLICLQHTAGSISPCAPRTHVRSSPAMQQTNKSEAAPKVDFYCKARSQPEASLAAHQVQSPRVSVTSLSTGR